MESQSVKPVSPNFTDSEVARTDRPAYEPPRVTVMDEAEVLKAFQFTSAAITWWVM